MNKRISPLAISLAISIGLTHSVNAESTPDSSVPGAGSAQAGAGLNTEAKSETNRATTKQDLLVPWNEMNQPFRSAYALARSDKYSTSGPLIIQKEDKLILDYKGKREETNIIPAEYSLLKSVAHIPLTIFVILEGADGKALSKPTLERLNNFRKSYSIASKNLELWNLSDECLKRQHLLIDKTSQFIDEIEKAGAIDRARLMEYTRQAGPLVLENAYEAISFELKAIDEQMKKWQATIPKDEWKRLHVAVMSGHMPREQNSAMLYFQKLLKQKREGQNIIYGEGKNEELYAIELVSTHMLDKDIAVYFFKDPWRMHRDLLSDGAMRYLKEHPPKRNNKVSASSQ